VATCAFERVSIGFPLQYNSTYGFVGTRCIVPLQPHVLAPRIDMVLFALDMLFYVAAGLAIFPLYRE